MTFGGYVTFAGLISVIILLIEHGSGVSPISQNTLGAFVAAAFIVGAFSAWSKERHARETAESATLLPSIYAYVKSAEYVAMAGSEHCWVAVKVFVANHRGITSIHDPFIWVQVNGVMTRGPLNHIDNIMELDGTFDGKPIKFRIDPEDSVITKIIGKELRDSVGHEGTILTFFYADRDGVDLSTLEFRFKDSHGAQYQAKRIKDANNP